MNAIKLVDKLKNHCLLFLCAAYAVFFIQPAYSQQTVGLFQNDAESYPGYTLISRDATSHLIDNAGFVVHTWTRSQSNFHSGYLLESGNFLALVGNAGQAGSAIGFEVLDWDSNIVWSWSDDGIFHDVVELPNGNILVLYRANYTNADAIAQGKDPATLNNGLTPVLIREIAAPGIVVWEWEAWDHLVQDFDSSKPNFGVVADHPELIDINYQLAVTANWHHSNSIDYNPVLDQIIISVRRFNEFWIIDHSTTTSDAAGHTGGNSGMGGDILYRWGNPATYDLGTVSDQQLFGQHDVSWIPEGLPGAGNITVFNNGAGGLFGGPGFSAAVEITPPLNGFNYDRASQAAYEPASAALIFQGNPTSDFFTAIMGSVQRLPNGNTLIDEAGEGRVFEVTASGEIVWEYVSPLFFGVGAPWNSPSNSALFKAPRYSLDHPAFVGRDLTPIAELEVWDDYADLTITSTQGGEAAREGIRSHGVGQLITLQAVADPGSQFMEWIVTSGTAAIVEKNAAHTTFVMGASAVTVEAIFVPIINIPAVPGVGLIVMLIIFGITRKLIFNKK